jgi:hypothetical protein
LIEYANEIRWRPSSWPDGCPIEMVKKGGRNSGKGGDRKSQSQSATVKLADL